MIQVKAQSETTTVLGDWDCGVDTLSARIGSSDNSNQAVSLFTVALNAGCILAGTECMGCWTTL